MTFFLAMVSLSVSRSARQTCISLPYLSCWSCTSPQRNFRLSSLTRKESEVTKATKLFAAAKPGWISKFSYLEESIFFLVFECRGSLRLVILAMFMNKRLAFRSEDLSCLLSPFLRSLSFRMLTGEPFSLKYLWMLHWIPEMAWNLARTLVRSSRGYS